MTVGIMKDHTDWINKIVVSPTHVYSISGDLTCRKTDVDTFKCVGVFKDTENGHDDRLKGLCLG